MVTAHPQAQHEWRFVDADLFECECGATADFDEASKDTRCVICEEYHTCDDRRLPNGDCECCWLASK